MRLCLRDCHESKSKRVTTRILRILSKLLLKRSRDSCVQGSKTLFYCETKVPCFRLTSIDVSIKPRTGSISSREYDRQATECRGQMTGWSGFANTWRMWSTGRQQCPFSSVQNYMPSASPSQLMCTRVLTERHIRFHVSVRKQSSPFSRSHRHIF